MLATVWMLNNLQPMATPSSAIEPDGSHRNPDQWSVKKLFDKCCPRVEKRVESGSMAAASKPKKRVVSDEHKAAMAAGRTESRAVKNYLEGLELTKPKRGRRRTEETVAARLEAVAEELDANPDPMTKLSLTQEQINLTKELEGMQSSIDVDMDGLEEAFIAAAADYSERKGISYGAWRKIGVSAEVLKAAGISRTRG